LVHLISCLTRGLTLPGPPGQLPSALSRALGDIRESPQELVAQRSRSTTPATSPATSRATSESRSLSPPPRPHESLPHHPHQMPQTTSTMGSSQQQRLSTMESSGWQLPSSGGRGIVSPQATGLDALFAQDPPERRQKHKDKESKQSYSGEQYHNKSEDVDSEPRFGESEQAHDFHFDKFATVDNLKTQFGAMLEAERILLRRAQQDADELEDELERTQDMASQLQQELRRDREESGHKVEVQRQLERQVVQAKSRLADLRETRKAANVDDVSFWRDREHFTQELTLMQDTFEEEGILLDKMKSANDCLERAYKAHVEHARQLETQRKEVLEMMERESRLLQRDERTTEEARAAFERLRRDVGDSKGISSAEVDILKPPKPPSMDFDNWLHPARGDTVRSRVSTASSPKSEIWRDDTASEQPRQTRSRPLPSALSSPQSSLWQDEAVSGQARSTAGSMRSTPKSSVWQDDVSIGQVKSDAQGWASSLVGGTFGLPSAARNTGGSEQVRIREGV